MKIPDVLGPEPDSLAEFTTKERKTPVIDWYRTRIPGPEFKALHRKSDFKGWRRARKVRERLGTDALPAVATGITHTAEAMEMGADAVLVNTAIAVASDPNRMAVAFKLAVEAGRAAYEMGLPASQSTAQATSPLTGFLD